MRNWVYHISAAEECSSIKMSQLNTFSSAIQLLDHNNAIRLTSSDISSSKASINWASHLPGTVGFHTISSLSWENGLMYVAFCSLTIIPSRSMSWSSDKLARELAVGGMVKNSYIFLDISQNCKLQFEMSLSIQLFSIICIRTVIESYLIM